MHGDKEVVVQVLDLLWNLKVFKLVVTYLLVVCIHPLLLLSFLLNELVILCLQLASLVVQVFRLLMLLDNELLHLVIVATIYLDQLPVVDLGFMDVSTGLVDLGLERVLSINYHGNVLLEFRMAIE